MPECDPSNCPDHGHISTTQASHSTLFKVAGSLVGLLLIVLVGMSVWSHFDLQEHIVKSSSNDMNTHVKIAELYGTVSLTNNNMMHMQSKMEDSFKDMERLIESTRPAYAGVVAGGFE